MKLLFVRARRRRRLFVLPKRALALPAALLCICALCVLTTLPASVTTAGAQRQLPIYSVERDQKMVSLTFDAAWGNAIMRRRRINGLRAGFWKIRGRPAAMSRMEVTPLAVPSSCQVVAASNSSNDQNVNIG